MAVFGIPVTHEDDALARRARGRRDAREARGAQRRVRVVVGRHGRGPHRGEHRRGADGRAERGAVARRRRRGQHRGSARAGGAAGRDPHRGATPTASSTRPSPPSRPVRWSSGARPRQSLPGACWRSIPKAPGWGRRLDSPLVGRARELAVLEDAFQRVVDERELRAGHRDGPGRRREVEAHRRADRRASGRRATVLQGRCLSYGDGITFWPIASVLMDAIGMEERDTQVEARRKLSELLATDRRGRRRRRRARERRTRRRSSASAQPTWGSRRPTGPSARFLERLAAARAARRRASTTSTGASATFLDLLDYLADWIQGAPVLILCQARPELLDIRPGG